MHAIYKCNINVSLIVDVLYKSQNKIPLSISVCEIMNRTYEIDQNIFIVHLQILVSYNGYRFVIAAHLTQLLKIEFYLLKK